MDITDLDHKAIGQRLIHAREGFAEVGMSVNQLAKRAGLNRATIYSYQKGRAMSLNAAWRISRALGFNSIEDMIGLSDDSAP